MTMNHRFAAAVEAARRSRPEDRHQVNACHLPPHVLTVASQPVAPPNRSTWNGPPSPTLAQAVLMRGRAVARSPRPHTFQVARRLDVLRALYRALSAPKRTRVEGPRDGFHRPSNTQHVGPWPVRTTSEWLDALDHVRENATAAALKGHFELRTDRVSYYTPSRASGVPVPHQPSEPTWTTCRVPVPVFVPAVLAPNESPWHMFDTDAEDTSRESALWFRGVRASFAEHEAAIRDAEPSERAALTLRLMAKAAERVTTTDGGRTVIQFVRVGRTPVVRIIDGKPVQVGVRDPYTVAKRVEVGSNETQPRNAQDVSDRPAQDAEREAADTDEWHAGSGIRKGHSHVHGLVTTDELAAQRQQEEVALGEQAEGILSWLRTAWHTPTAPAWYRVPTREENAPARVEVHRVNAAVKVYKGARRNGKVLTVRDIIALGRGMRAAVYGPVTEADAVKLAMLRDLAHQAQAATEYKAPDLTPLKASAWTVTRTKPNAGEWTWTDARQPDATIIGTREDPSPYIEERADEGIHF